ncbi:MAG: hypothetical protein K0M56_05635 [Kaistella sp.]|nr:hypothetical protein [Kaistella sp.]
MKIEVTKAGSPPAEVIRASGKLCPESGEWEIQGERTTSTVLSKNQVMPEYCGKKVYWKLVRKG